MANELTLTFTPGLPPEDLYRYPCVFWLRDGSIAEGVIVILRGALTLVTYDTTYGPQKADSKQVPAEPNVVGYTPCRAVAARA